MPTPKSPAPPQPKLKNDLEKFGIFKDDGYLRGVEPYIPPDNFVWNEHVHKGKQFLIKIPGKKKDATLKGYFGTFERAFEGECVSDPLREYRKRQQETKRKFYAGQFQMSSPGKKLLGKGHYHGTFGGQVEAFSPVVRPKPSLAELMPDEKPKPIKPFKIKHPKKGSGYGTGDVTLHQYPLSSQPEPIRYGTFHANLDSERQLWDYYKRHSNYINKNPFYTNPEDLPKRSKLKPMSGKLRLARLATGLPFKPSGRGTKLGGCKDGCFTSFVKYGNYFLPPERKKKVIKPLNLDPFYTGGAKSSTYKSILQTNVDKYVTSKSYKAIERVMYRAAKAK